MDMSQVTDPRTQQLLRERGVAGALIYPAHSRKGQIEQKIIQEVAAQRAQEVENENRLNAQQQQHALAERERQDRFKQQQDSTNAYREGLKQSRDAAESDRRTQLNSRILENWASYAPQFGAAAPAVQKALVDQLVRGSGIGPITVPPDPDKVALARSKGLTIPEATTIGSPVATPNPTEDPNTPKSMPTTGGFINPAQFDSKLGANVQNTSAGPFVVGAPDPSVGATEGSALTDLGGGRGQLTFPSGGTARFALREKGQPVSFERFAATHPKYNVEAPSLANQVIEPSSLVEGANTSPSRGPAIASGGQASLDATRPDILPTSRPGFEGLKNFFGGNVTPEQQAAVGAHPEIQPTARPGFDFLAGRVSPEQIEAANRPSPQATPTMTPSLVENHTNMNRSPGATPQGTPLGGPFSGINFSQIVNQPNAPTPNPLNTPPAIPPVQRPTAEEERRRLMVNQ